MMPSSIQPDPAATLPPRSGNSISFLRVVLAAMVIYTHAYYLGGFGEEPLMRWTSGALNIGTVAVQCFFVLSGWLVASSWLRLNSLPVFLWHRLLRIAPGFIVCLVVTAAVFGPVIHFTTSGDRENYLALHPGAWDYVWKNLLRPRGQIGIGDLLAHSPHPVDLNGSLWTLFYEAACYVAVALCGLAAVLRHRGRIGLSFLLLGAILVVQPLARSGIFPGIYLRLFDTPGKLMCWHFATGIICALFPTIVGWLGRKHWPALLGLSVLIAGWWLGFGAIVSPIALPSVLFWLAHQLPLRNWEQQVGGDYSYGLYVYGYPAQQLLAHWGVHHLGLVLFTLLSLVTAGGFAWLSWNLIEHPALQLRHVFTPGRRVAQPA